MAIIQSPNRRALIIGILQGGPRKGARICRHSHVGSNQTTFNSALPRSPMYVYTAVDIDIDVDIGADYIYIYREIQI